MRQAREIAVQNVKDEAHRLAVMDPWEMSQGGGFVLVTDLDYPAAVDFSRGEAGERFIGVYAGPVAVSNFLLSRTARSRGCGATRINNLDISRSLVLLEIEDTVLSEMTYLDGTVPEDMEPDMDDIKMTEEALASALKILKEAGPGAFIEDVVVESQIVAPGHKVVCAPAPEGTGAFEVFNLPVFFMNTMPRYGIYVSGDGSERILYAVASEPAGDALIPLTGRGNFGEPGLERFRVRDPRSAAVLSSLRGTDLQVFLQKEDRIDSLDDVMDRTSDLLFLLFDDAVSTTAEGSYVDGMEIGRKAQEIMDDPDFMRVSNRDLIRKHA